MADASGTCKGTEAFETLTRTKRSLGVIFRSPEREGPAKLRQRAVRALCKFVRVGAHLRVAWRHYNCCETLFVWEGEVVCEGPSYLKSVGWHTQGGSSVTRGTFGRYISCSVRGEAAHDSPLSLLTEYRCRALRGAGE